jgi:hypothetical protein
VQIDGNKFRVESGQTDGKKVLSEWTVCEPKNIGRANATTADEQAISEAQAKWDKKVKLGYTTDVTKIDSSTSFVEPMLAKDYDDYMNKMDWDEGVFVQNKYNGVRCVATLEGGEVVLKSRKGEKWVSVPHINKDLEKFFDRVNHSKLIEVLSRSIKDGRVVSLIHKYLNAGVQTSVGFEPSEMGVPQGGPLSPLLSNIMLNELDKELERRGHKFVRYADDMIILCKSKRSAERVMSSITRFLEEKLFLKVNRDKSQVAYMTKVKFLGYAFYQTKGKWRLRTHPKSVSKMKSKIKELTSRSNGWGYERRKETLRQYIVGWVNYFKLSDMDSLLQRVDEWYRRRLRMVIWKQWKRTKTKMTNLMKLGVKKSKAWEWANTRKGYWHIANSYILSTTITNERLSKAGYPYLSDSYRKVRVNA